MDHQFEGGGRLHLAPTHEAPWEARSDPVRHPVASTLIKLNESLLLVTLVGDGISTVFAGSLTRRVFCLTHSTARTLCGVGPAV